MGLILLASFAPLHGVDPRNYSRQTSWSGLAEFFCPRIIDGLGPIANYLVLRLTDVDAKALVRNVASSQQERALIDKIKQMDRFKALYFCEGKSRPSIVNLMS
jgi:hypothetical protein